GCEIMLDTSIIENNIFDISFDVEIEDTSICWYQSIHFTFNSTNADSIEIQEYRPVPSYSYIEITDETMEYDYNITEKNYFNIKAYNKYCREDYKTGEFKYYPDRELMIAENDDPVNDTIIVKGNDGRWFAQALVSDPNGLLVEWEPVEGISAPDSLGTWISPGESMWYAIKITTLEGDCADQDSIYVTYVPDIDTYDGFSPNGDGINDFWYIENINAFKNNVVTVYTRWGTKVFEQKGYNNNDSNKRWDGSAKNGKPIGSGTYYYIINLNEEGFSPVTGAVTIMR
ncbi:MAG TPA: gliding motility-associated C-terminal domain-containing protein, partial [Bacteroidales bacterium]|nr:gliding motility-associated C-terminal domain-containing protein [Bacteroidales bacterium]